MPPGGLLNLAGYSQARVAQQTPAALWGKLGGWSITYTTIAGHDLGMCRFRYGD